MAMFFEGASIRSEDLKGNSFFKSFLADAKEFVARAERRHETLRRRGPGKPPHMHDYILIWEAAEVFEEAGGKASINTEANSPFARFIIELYDYVPKGLRPGTSDKFLNAAQRALGLEDESDCAGYLSPGSIWKRRQDRRAQQVKVFAGGKTVTTLSAKAKEPLINPANMAHWRH